MSDTSKTWLVTGTARGLGRFISEAVLAAGDRLVAGARYPERLVDLVERYGDRIRPVALDVTDEVAARHAVDLALNAFGRLDVLVNNAGYGHTTPFEQMTTQDFRDQVETNLFGVVNLTRAVLPVMREQHAGHIFQVSSAGAGPRRQDCLPIRQQNGPSAASAMSWRRKLLTWASGYVRWNRGECAPTGPAKQGAMLMAYCQTTTSRSERC